MIVFIFNFLAQVGRKSVLHSEDALKLDKKMFCNREYLACDAVEWAVYAILKPRKVVSDVDKAFLDPFRRG